MTLSTWHMLSWLFGYCPSCGVFSGFLPSQKTGILFSVDFFTCSGCVFCVDFVFSSVTWIKGCLLMNNSS